MSNVHILVSMLSAKPIPIFTPPGERNQFQYLRGAFVTKLHVSQDTANPTVPPTNPQPILFFNCMFYQLLRVQHSCSSTQSWGSVLPSIVRRETRIPGVAPFSFRIGIWDLFVHRGQKSYTPTAFGKLWTTPE